MATNVALSSTARPLMDRRYRDMGDVLAHVREQAALLVLRVNPGHTWTGMQFRDKTAQVYAAMIIKLTRDFEAMGRPDLAGKIVLALEQEGQTR